MFQQNISGWGRFIVDRDFQIALELLSIWNTGPLGREAFPHPPL
jgi:hypothetical protein